MAIPLLSLSTSKIVGTVAGGGHYGRAASGSLIGLAVLAVSLSHLLWAVRDVTGSGPQASWALTVALDYSLVLCERVHAAASEPGWAVLVTGAYESSTMLSSYAPGQSRG